MNENQTQCPIGRKRGWGEIVLLQAVALAWGLALAFLLTALVAG